MKTHLLATVFSAMAILAGCSQKSMNTEDQTITKEAQLVWSGEYMVDGCGFKLIIDGRDYKPEDEEAIDASFKTEEGTIPVKVTYTETGETIDRRCGLSTEDRSMPGIRITSLERL